jgi:uncharacterized integral membrane protein
MLTNLSSAKLLISICLLTAIGLTAGGSSTVHIYTQTIHRTAQLTTLVVRLSGIRTQIGQTKMNNELKVKGKVHPCTGTEALYRP